MVNLQELLDSMDVFRKVTGLRLQDIYNLMLKKGWTLGSPQLMVGMHWVIRLFHSKTVRLLEGFWREHRPEMVVSLVPNFNRALGESLARALPGVPFVTILTDIADYPPHFWIERAGATFHMRFGEGGGAGARHGARRRQGASRFGHDSESTILRDCSAIGRRAGRSAREVGLRLRQAGGTGAIRGTGLGRDAGDRAIAARSADAADLRQQCKVARKATDAAPRRADLRGRVHQRGAAIYAAGRLLHREAGAGQYQ